LLAQLLAAIFFVWLFPVASNARETLASRKWLHLPLSLKERFIVRTVSLLMPPSAWLVILGSVAICYPLAHARNPGAGIVAGLLFIAMAWLTGLTIAHLLNSTAWRKLFSIAALALLSVASVNVIREGAAGELLSFRFFPTTFVERAAMGNLGNGAILVSLATLGILSVAAGAAVVQ
jgi:hypothetical protein